MYIAITKKGKTKSYKHKSVTSILTNYIIWKVDTNRTLGRIKNEHFKCTVYWCWSVKHFLECNPPPAVHSANSCQLTRYFWTSFCVCFFFFSFRHSTSTLFWQNKEKKDVSGKSYWRLQLLSALNNKIKPSTFPPLHRLMVCSFLLAKYRSLKLG